MRLAGVQIEITFGQPVLNRKKIRQWYQRARRENADLVLFPECATSGYCFDSRAEAWPFAESLEGETVQFACELVRQQGGKLVLGMLEQKGERLYNSAILVDAGGLQAVYRKVHLPYLGVDRFVDFGDEPFMVHDIDGTRIGLNICYDSGFPESARALALAGADLILLPTNWPTGAETLAEHAINTRAMENGVFYAAVNRIGTERGFRFIGLSRICDLSGRTLAAGSGDREELLIADIEPARARVKTVVRVPGAQLIDRLADRRPEFYGLLTAPTGRKQPGREIPPHEFR